ncbi:MAG: hypothetical protein C0490_27565 [Marivirga sp.]|nr:hypothetical protein [Marivirga sp.]
MFFFLMVVSALSFAAVYVYFQSLVETNALAFSIGLVTVMIVGMYGMMDSIVSCTTVEKQKVY